MTPPQPTACTCGHKPMFCHKLNAQKWCGAGWVEAERDRYREALEKIANADYRGNRSYESTIAYRALHPQSRELLAQDGFDI